MKFRDLKQTLLITLLVSIIIPAGSANACRFKARDFEELYNEAETVFIGVVKQIDGGSVKFSIDRALKNAFEGEIFTTEQGLSSCHVRFGENQQWLFLGPTLMSGTRILKDENGIVQQYNADFVEKRFGKIDDESQRRMQYDREPVACTMEAKLCPDGSYVARTGPNCEFAACP